MSASSIVLVPLVLLGLVTALCFVGCVLNRYGTGPIGPGPGPIPSTAYRTLVLGDNPVAFWPLDDADQSAKAAELKSGLVGDYVTVTFDDDKDQFPDPPVDNVSAPAPGKLEWQQAGIVPGDFKNDPNNPSPCIQVDGGYVSVPQHVELNPPSFTVEAWVRVDWNVNDPVNFPPAYRLVVDSRTVAGGNVTGFALFATPDNHWAVAVGGGAVGQTILPADIVAFDGKPVYLAATYDGGTQKLTLFVNGISSVAPLMGVPYAQNTTSALFIGSGAPSGLMRPQPPNVLPEDTKPLFPFVGAIQDVAIYSTALAGGTMDMNDVIFTHAQNGIGLG
jgi:Concanavalin A-like lectin/glucanases superfamily